MTYVLQRITTSKGGDIVGNRNRPFFRELEVYIHRPDRIGMPLNDDGLGIQLPDMASTFDSKSFEGSGGSPGVMIAGMHGVGDAGRKGIGVNQ